MTPTGGERYVPSPVDGIAVFWVAAHVWASRESLRMRSLEPETPPPRRT